MAYSDSVKAQIQSYADQQGISDRVHPADPALDCPVPEALGHVNELEVVDVADSEHVTHVGAGKHQETHQY
jgi:hypothetical protein